MADELDLPDFGDDVSSADMNRILTRCLVSKRKDDKKGVGRTEDLLGRVPLFPCFLNGNATSTIPNKYAPLTTLLDRSRPSNSDVPTEQARDHAGPATFMRSTPGCGT
jgi:hypothetical protein